MKFDGRNVLTKISARHGARTREANLWVRGVPEPLDRRATLKIDATRVDAFANSTKLFLQMRCDSGVLFSTPRKDIGMNIRQLLGQVAGHDIFVSELGLALPVPWIYSRAAVDGLQSLAMRDDELLTATVGGLSALLEAGDEDSTLERFSRLVSFARSLPAAAPAAAMDPHKLPADLRGLVSLAATWGLSDDAERSELVERAGDSELRTLVEQGRPHLARIAEFLRAPGVAGDSPEVGQLDSLAQAVMEAEQKLRRRANA